LPKKFDDASLAFFFAVKQCLSNEVNEKNYSEEKTSISPNFFCRMKCFNIVGKNISYILPGRESGADEFCTFAASH
jgi:hypothetical protein